MDSARMRERKRQCRRRAAALVAALSAPARRRLDAALLARARALPLVRGLPDGAWVFGYASLPDEPDLTAFWRWLAAGGKRLAFPRWPPLPATNRHGAAAGAAPASLSPPPLAFHDAGLPPPLDAADAALKAAGWERIGRDGRAPAAEAPIVPAARAALAIVPGRAFAPGGTRLGRGAGCYDAWFASLPVRPPTLALAYDEQILDDLPRAPHDFSVDMWVTPTRDWR